MTRLAQEWRDVYKTSGSKERGMEKVLLKLLRIEEETEGAR